MSAITPILCEVDTVGSSVSMGVWPEERMNTYTAVNGIYVIRVTDFITDGCHPYFLFQRRTCGTVYQLNNLKILKFVRNIPSSI